MPEETEVSSMEKEEYAKMADFDDSMWWYLALHRNILYLLRRFLPEGPADVLDAGCGTGGLLKFLISQEPGRRFQGMEHYAPASEIAASRANCPVACGSINALPFEDASLDAILDTDVLSQKGVDPNKVAKEAYRCLRPGGVYIASEVAFDWLQSYHDKQVGVARRFTRAQLLGILRQGGFEVPYSSYWNFVLFPLVVLRRKVFSADTTESDVKAYSKPAEMIFNGVMAAERGWLRMGGKFPFGVSVMSVGVKPHET